MEVAGKVIRCTDFPSSCSSVAATTRVKPSVALCVEPQISTSCSELLSELEETKSIAETSAASCWKKEITSSQGNAPGGCESGPSRVGGASGVQRSVLPRTNSSDAHV